MASQLGPIVVGTDFSEPAAVALAEARRLASLLRTRVQLVHVVDGNPAARWGNQGEADSWLRAARVEPDSLVVRFGSPWAELVRFASKAAPVLMVVGSHGQSGYQPLTIGSTAARVTVHARCPVVLVSPRTVPIDAAAEEFTGREGVASSARNQPG